MWRLACPRQLLGRRRVATKLAISHGAGTLLVSGVGLRDQGLGFFENLLEYTVEQKRWASVINASAAVLAVAWIIRVYAAIWLPGTIGAMMRLNRYCGLPATSSQVAAQGSD